MIFSRFKFGDLMRLRILKDQIPADTQSKEQVSLLDLRTLFAQIKDDLNVALDNHNEIEKSVIGSRLKVVDYTPGSANLFLNMLFPDLDNVERSSAFNENKPDTDDELTFSFVSDTHECMHTVLLSSETKRGELSFIFFTLSESSAPENTLITSVAYLAFDSSTIKSSDFSNVETLKGLMEKEIPESLKQYQQDLYRRVLISRRKNSEFVLIEEHAAEDKDANITLQSMEAFLRGNTLAPEYRQLVFSLRESIKKVIK